MLNRNLIEINAVTKEQLQSIAMRLGMCNSHRMMCAHKSE